jgi:AhpD family alkylhydroperoxidase
MQARLNYIKTSPATYQALRALQATVDQCGLEKPLLELVKIRASQINKCTFCLQMHTRDARKAGVSEERIYVLEAWRESPLYTDRERAALAWTEALTLLPETGAPDDVYAQVTAYFTDGRDRGPHARHRRHQSMEPFRRRLPAGAPLRGAARGGVTVSAAGARPLASTVAVYCCACARGPDPVPALLWCQTQRA